MGYYGRFAIFPLRNCMFVVFVRYCNIIYLVPNKAVKKNQLVSVTHSVRVSIYLIICRIFFNEPHAVPESTILFLPLQGNLN
jgi:hypothetical protein